MRQPAGTGTRGDAHRRMTIIVTPAPHRSIEYDVHRLAKCWTGWVRSPRRHRLASGTPLMAAARRRCTRRTIAPRWKSARTGRMGPSFAQLSHCDNSTPSALCSPWRSASFSQLIGLSQPTMKRRTLRGIASSPASSSDVRDSRRNEGRPQRIQTDGSTQPAPTTILVSCGVAPFGSLANFWHAGHCWSDIIRTVA